MRPDESPTPALVRRAAAVARGPHACPCCERSTWTEPPEPWPGLRDYLVRCDACERPIAVHVDRQRILRRRAGAPARGAADRVVVDPVAELLDRQDLRAFAARVLAAAVAPVLMVTIAGRAGAPLDVLFLLTLAAVVVGSMWAPALLAGAWSMALEHAARLRELRPGRVQRPRTVVALEPGRWDAWMREERRRAAESGLPRTPPPRGARSLRRAQAAGM